MYGFCLTFASTLDKEDLENAVSEFYRVVDEANITGLFTTRELNNKEILEERGSFFSNKK